MKPTNKPEDKSGANLPRSLLTRTIDAAMPKIKQDAKPRKAQPLTVLLTRLARYEARIKAIQDLCDEWIDKHGEEPSTITRIKQFADGDYDR
jgi:hypothetical protein